MQVDIKEVKTACQLRKQITALWVVDTNKEYHVGQDGVKSIEFKAGTSGHEYNVIYDKTIIQLRGLKFVAEWSR